MNIDSEANAVFLARERLKDTQQNKHLVPDAYKAIASGMEKQFIKYMVEEMDKTISRSEQQSSSEEYYNSLLQNEFANKISQSDSLGIQDIILDQIYPRNQRNSFNYNNFLKNKNNGDRP